MAKKYIQYQDTPFKQKIRIKPAQLEWIRNNKGDYTLAGKLDEIINFYKNGKKVRTSSESRSGSRATKTVQGKVSE